MKSKIPPAPIKPQASEANNKNVEELKDQITILSKKIDEIYHQVSVIQFMVDNHERIIRNRDNILQKDNKPQDSPIKELTKKDIPQKKVLPSESKTKENVKPQIKNPPSENNIYKQSYDKAFEAYKKNEYENALTLFKLFEEKYPVNDLSDNALYWAGECYYSQKKFNEAIEVFKKLLQKYPNGSKVPDALLKIGYCYISLGEKEKGYTYLKEVVKNFPFSPAGAKAEEDLRRLN
ncbi:MAG: tol-pal system protein YbgF [Desulfobacterales bacterium]|nr:tol-pal system protein YbgF [Desulfobacterales bacterium]